MMSKCPNCGEKLSPFYMKQNCPKCQVNLVYYDLENRLLADHKKAIAEQEAVDRVLNNIKTSAFGGPLQIIRFVLMFIPLAFMCLPVVTNLNSMGVTLISIIMDIIKGRFSLEGMYLYALVTMACIIVFSLMVIISSLFSIGKKALKRNIIFSSINFLVLVGCSVWISLNDTLNIGIGLALVYFSYIGTEILHKVIDKKLNG